jgi:carboxymethylenebutenolidase
MSKSVAFKSKTGKEEHGEIAEPASGGKAPGIVLLQEYWGINDNIRGWTDRLGKEGFLTLTPDLYHGKSTKDPGEAGKLMQSLDWGVAMQDIAGAVAFLKEHPKGNGKVAVMGFCMGGALSFAAAANVPGLSAVVPFYGIPGTKVDATKVTAPIQAHFSKTDEWAKPALAESIKEELGKLGKPMELFVYDAGHAFMNEHRPEVHDPGASKIALGRALTFLRSHLA